MHSIMRNCAAAAAAALGLVGCGGAGGIVERLPVETGDAVAHHKINYVELKASDVAAMKDFYGAAFGWTFVDYGPDYASFEGAGLDGGFERVDGARAGGGTLVILYSDDLEASRKAVTDAGGVISTEPFDFPGGRRFHFTDPAGNELAVWTKAAE